VVASFSFILNALMTTDPLLVVFFCIFGYICGSIPFSYVFTFYAGLGDIRQMGSKNVGATNVLRTGRLDIAVLSLVFDVFKATVPAAIGLILVAPTIGLLAGFCAFLGHIFPLWLWFRGGKGVACYLGVLLAVATPYALFFTLVWFVMVALFRYSSLSALISSLLTALLLVTTHNPLSFGIILMTCILWIAHWRNITLLLQGKEKTIGYKDS
jgi:glycerol-3-phosphate acyltransferase PlsY